MLFSASETSATPVDLKSGEAAGTPVEEFWVSLDSQPTSDVAITFTSSNFSDLGLGDDVFDFPLGATEDLVFTSADWSVPQNIVLRALSDVDVEGVEVVPITWDAISTDPVFDPLSGSLDVTIYDDDSDGDLLVINEFVANHAGTDTGEFVELKNLNDSVLGATFATFHLLQVDGDGADQGLIDSITEVSPGIGVGAYATFYFNNQVEDGSLTWVLVEGFDTNLIVGSDLDTDNDGQLDLPLPWTAVSGAPRDAIAIDDGDVGDGHYAGVVLDPGFDAPNPGSGSVVGGISRIPDGFVDSVGGSFRTASDLDDRFGWNLGTATSISSKWDVFTVPVGAPGNLPDVSSFGSGNTSVLTQTKTSAFIASSGNIYSFADATDFDVTIDTSDLVGTQTRIVAQWKTFGSPLDFSSIEIGGVAPIYTQILGQGSTGLDFMAVWDLSSSPQSSYDIEFMASGTSMSLAEFQVDAFAQGTAFPEPSPFNPYVRNNPFGLPSPGTDVVPGTAVNTRNAVNEVVPGLLIIEDGGSTTLDESQVGTIESYQLFMGTDPTAPVTVSISADAQQQIAVDTDGDGNSSNETFASTLSVNFGIGDGMTSQTVFVRVVDDAATESNPHAGSITHSAASLDPLYNGSAAFPKLLDNEFGTAGSAVTVSVIDDDGDTVPPTITNVYASGTGWNATFLDAADGGGSNNGNGIGFDLTDGQLISNQGVDRIYVQFSEDVTGFSTSNVQFLGVNTGNFSGGMTLSYNASTFVGTIALSTRLNNDKLRLAVNDAIADDGGNQLDGDGLLGDGGVFDFRFNVLVGDVQGDTSVDGGDIPALGASFNQSFPLLAYNINADINSDGSIDGGDFAPLGGNFNQSLPSDDPDAPNFGGGFSAFARSVDEIFSGLDDDEDDSISGEPQLF